jgi:hypothetical protein
MPPQVATPIHESKVAPGKTVELVLVRLGDIFVVSSITNTTWYRPGDHVTVDTAQKCCDLPNWKVTMIDNQIISSVLGGISGAVSAGIGTGLLGKV